jgi:HD-like signal output (HDOD) protein
MSPEAARGEAPVPAMDVFAAGVLLGELLSGGPLLRERDPMRAVQRVQQEDLELPATWKVDDSLRGIVQRALARDVRTRYDSARSMRDALLAWLHPDSDRRTPMPPGQPRHAGLPAAPHAPQDRLPGAGESVVRIQRLATSDTESLASLSAEILRDVALTNKLLRMVNTVQFTAVAGGGISTVSRAVALVGFAGIRNMALSVLLLEHMQTRQHAAQLKEEFLRALMAGTLAGELAPLARESEEAFIGAMFQNLGRLLTEYYFPEEAVQIRQQVARNDTTATREMAARRILGIGLEDLGLGVAKAWGLPDSLQKALRVPEGDVPQHAAPAGVERLRWMGRGANAMAAAMLSSDGEAQTAALRAAADQYAHVLGVPARQIVSATLESREQLRQLASAMGLQVAVGAPARRLLEATMTMSEQATVATAALHAHDKTLIESHPDSESPLVALTRGLTELRASLATR